MVDRALVTSGADIEVLMSEDYLRHALVAQIEAGVLPTSIEVVDADSGLDLLVSIHPPPDVERRYAPHPAAVLPEAVAGSFDVEILPEGGEGFAHLQLFVTIDDRASDEIHPQVPGGLLFDIALTHESSSFGLEEGHRLAISFLRLDDATRALVQFAGGDPAPIEAEIKSRLDREVDLSALGGQRVQSIALRRFVAPAKRSVGVYLDLALRAGPEKHLYRPGRMDVANAQDFRPDGKPLAMATAPGLFQLLGPDLKFRQAEETSPGSGQFRFPLRKNPLNRQSEQIGKIKGISVGPEFHPSTAALTGRLMIDLHGEYTEFIGDPDFHLQLFVRPEIDAEGLVEFDLRVDVDLGLLATLIAVAAGILLTVLFAPGAGLGTILLIGAFGGILVANGIASEPVVSKLMEDRLEKTSDASFFDALPFRVTAVRRRWDPFYVTEHQIVALARDGVTIDFNGIDFAATGLKLDKEPAVRENVVVRDEMRDAAGQVSGLRYRVNDIDRVVPLAEVAPGADRLPFVVDDPAEPTLVTLTLDQAQERKDTDRLHAPVNYNAKRVHIVEGQIAHLLCLSRREENELRGVIVGEFRAEKKAEITADEGAQIEADAAVDLEALLGRPPTADELAEEVDRRIEALVDELQPDFEENELPGLLNPELAQVLRFDLPPEEMIGLQRGGLVNLDDVEVIVRRSDDGTETPYYRDHPDADPRDNLLNLPRYTPPYVPPDDA